MDMKQIITATVAVILVCLVAIPLIDQSSESVYTTDQNTTEYYIMSDKNTDITIQYTNGKILLNDKDITDVLSITEYRPVIITDSFIVATLNQDLYIFHDNIRDEATTVTMSGGSANYTDITSSTQRDLSYTLSYVWSESGSYGLFKTDGESTQSFNVSTDNTYYVLPFNTYRVGYGACYGLYEYKGAEMVKAIIPAAFSPTSPTDIPAAESVVFNIGIDEAKSDRLHYNISLNSTNTNTVLNNVTVPADSMLFLAPIEYEMISQNDSMIITILDLIPVLLVAAVLIGIGYSIMRRD